MTHTSIISQIGRANLTCEIVPAVFLEQALSISFIYPFFLISSFFMSLAVFQRIFLNKFKQ